MSRPDGPDRPDAQCDPGTTAPDTTAPDTTAPPAPHTPAPPAPGDGIPASAVSRPVATGAPAARHQAPPGATDDEADDAPFSHRPVMVAEVVGLLAAVPPGVVLDATVGGGGHARAILEAYPNLRIVGLDQDPAAVAAAIHSLAPFGGRAEIHRARFDRLAEILDGAGVAELSAALFDLGVSSPQLDRPARGFTYRVDAPLDMRMDPGGPTTAADLVNTMREQELIQLLFDNGEGRFARRIARAIIAARPVTTTAQLADVVRTAIPAAARRTGGHPARRVFQGLRIAVNDELGVLPSALDRALERLAPGGRAVVLAYHSGEDRLVKQHFQRAATGGCVCPPGLPCQCGATPTVRLLTRGARKPTPEELADNPRSGSARLRAVERLSTHHEEVGRS